jgi:hypothetical protein
VIPLAPRRPTRLEIHARAGGREGWGFTFKSELFVWVKITQKDGRPHMGKGLTTRKFCETAWLATRGKGLQFREHVSQLIETEDDLRLIIEAPKPPGLSLTGVRSIIPDHALGLRTRASPTNPMSHSNAPMAMCAGSICSLAGSGRGGRDGATRCGKLLRSMQWN